MLYVLQCVTSCHITCDVTCYMYNVICTTYMYIVISTMCVCAWKIGFVTGKSSEGARDLRERARHYSGIHCIAVCLRMNAREKREKGARESARTHCNTLQHTALQRRARACSLFLYALCNPCDALQHIQHTATHCNILQHTATHCAREEHKREAQRVK